MVLQLLVDADIEDWLEDKEGEPIVKGLLNVEFLEFGWDMPSDDVRILFDSSRSNEDVS